MGHIVCDDAHRCACRCRVSERRDGSREGLDSVAGNQLGGDAAGDLNDEGKSGNVDKDDVCCAKLKHVGLEHLCVSGLSHEC